MAVRPEDEGDPTRSELESLRQRAKKVLEENAAFLALLRSTLAHANALRESLQAEQQLWLSRGGGGRQDLGRAESTQTTHE